MPDRYFDHVGASDPFVAFIREQRCCVCNRGPSEPHHVVTRGASGGNYHGYVVPLERECHDELDDCGQETFQARHDVDFDEVYRRLRLRFDEEQARGRVLGRTLPPVSTVVSATGAPLDGAVRFYVEGPDGRTAVVYSYDKTLEVLSDRTLSVSAAMFAKMTGEAPAVTVKWPMKEPDR